jgi:Fic family protein
VALNEELVWLLSQADRALGELAGVARTLPNPQLLVAPLSQREAVLSSRIEGTQASVSDLAIFEAAGAARPGTRSDVLEVRNYRLTMDYGVQRMQELPLSLRLVRELHERLLAGVRGQEMTPGEFRTSQNWVGPPGCLLNDATFVPPPPSELMDCLRDWEAFLHEELKMPPIVKCALMHYQFEAIHPFLDGNGRVGRLLIVLFLCSTGLLPAPVLYLSSFFERHRQDYYDHLRAVSEKSAWDEWLAFFMRAVIVQCKEALVRSDGLMRLHEQYRQALLGARAAPSAHRLTEDLFVIPATTASMAARRLGVTVMSASRSIQALTELGILEEVTGRRRDRVYLAGRLVETIEAESGVEDSYGKLSTLIS